MDFLYNLLPKRVQNISSYMDFDGQKKAEQIFQVTIGIFAVVGFVWGYLCQQFSQTVYILLAGFILSCILTLPPWPMYRRKPLNWQPARSIVDSANDTGEPHSTPAKEASTTSTKGKKGKKQQ